MKSKCLKKKCSFIEPTKDELKQSQYYQTTFKTVINQCLEKLKGRRIEKIVCYGLGTFHGRMEKSSRIQLALLILLFEYLEEKGAPLNPVIETYDPSFEEADIEVLLLINRPKFQLIPNNELCAREAQTTIHRGCVLFYMIHLDKTFYNNLLGANWTRDGLSKIVILGNSFRDMIEGEITFQGRKELHYVNTLVANFDRGARFPRRSKLKDYSYTYMPDRPLMPADRALFELELDDSSYSRSDVFNNLSVHLVNELFLVKRPKVVEEYSLSNWKPSLGCPLHIPGQDWLINYPATNL